MQLSALIAPLQFAIAGDNDPDIAKICIDSREVSAGSLFIAYAGHEADGREFIADAIKNGAVAVLTTPDVKVEGAIHLEHDDPRACVSLLAGIFYPEKPAHLLAVTGTNGKTSVVSFARQLLARMGHKAASIGTLGIQLQDGETITEFGDNAALTSADPISLHRDLQALAESGVTHVCMEASSIGIDQNRLDHLPLQIAAFTNLSHDHLDYHGTMAVYFEAKKRLFSHVLETSERDNKTAVLPSDSEHLGELRESVSCFTLTYGNGGHVSCHHGDMTTEGMNLTITHANESFTEILPLIGVFQAENVLCAIGMLLALDIPMGLIAAELPHITAVPGRMELVASGVVVDYAHTPDALETALKALRHHTSGKLHVLFGCGGDRDTSKRPEMGKIAEELADVVTITDDNPRTEDASTIRAEILAACRGATEIADRAEAISHAISQLEVGDILLIAGKGHEDYQLIGTEKQPFSDGEVVRGVLKQRA